MNESLSQYNLISAQTMSSVMDATGNDNRRVSRPFDSASSEAPKRYYNPSFRPPTWPQAQTCSPATRLVKMEEVAERMWILPTSPKCTNSEISESSCSKEHLCIPTSPKATGSADGLAACKQQWGSDSVHSDSQRNSVCTNGYQKEFEPGENISPSNALPSTVEIVHDKDSEKMDAAQSNKIFMPSNLTSMLYSTVHTKKRKKCKSSEWYGTGCVPWASCLPVAHKIQTLFPSRKQRKSSRRVQEEKKANKPNTQCISALRHKLPCCHRQDISLTLSSLDPSTKDTVGNTPYGSPFFTTSTLFHSPLSPELATHFKESCAKSWIRTEVSSTGITEDCSTLDGSEFSYPGSDIFSHTVYWSPPVLKTDSDYEASRRYPTKRMKAAH